MISQSLKTVLLSSIFIAGSVQAEGGGAGGGMFNPFNPGFSPSQQKFLLENTGRGRSVATGFDEMISKNDEYMRNLLNNLFANKDLTDGQKDQYIMLIMNELDHVDLQKIINNGDGDQFVSYVTARVDLNAEPKKQRKSMELTKRLYFRTYFYMEGLNKDEG